MTFSRIQTPPFELEQMWNAVLSRDSSFDGQFVYAVRSTGIYCRPTCPSRRPRPSQAVYFAAPNEARSAGYRPCRRCRPDLNGEAAELVPRACEYIDAYTLDHDSHPTMTELSNALHVPESRLIRLFKKETGLTPSQYGRGRRLERFKAMVKEGENVTEAMYQAGYGSSSRLYEDAGRQIGMTPASYRKGGAGAVIGYIVADSALGDLLVAGTSIGVCAVKLGDDADALERELKDEFPAADILRVGPHDKGAENESLLAWVKAIQEYLEGSQLNVDLPLDVLATIFQWRVWRKLQSIPAGETRTYQQLAEEMEQPAASRAVGRACATNPVAPIVPCHRAVRKDGGLAGYRWGLHRKEALLEMERRQS